MPRDRSRTRNRSNEEPQDSAATAVATVDNDNNTKERKLTSLSPDMISELLAKTRSRGDYGTVLAEFLKSGEAGIEVPLDSGPLAGKTAAQAAVGFNNARTGVNKETGQPNHPGGHAVKVIKQVDKDSEGNELPGGRVFLINTALVQTGE